MTDEVARRAAIESAVLSTGGVRALFPASPLPGAERVVLRDDGRSCALRIAADVETDSVRLIESVTTAARRAAGDPTLELRIEIASID